MSIDTQVVARKVIATTRRALPGSLYQPKGVAVDAGGTLYVSSAGAVLKIKLP